MELPPINSQRADPNASNQNRYILSPTQMSPVKRSPSVEGMSPLADKRRNIFMSQRKTVDLDSRPGGGYVSVTNTVERPR